MYCVNAVIVAVIINNCCAEIIRLEDIKFQVNGAPSVSKSYDYIATTQGTVRVNVQEDKKGTELEVTSIKNIARITNATEEKTEANATSENTRTKKSKSENNLTKKLRSADKAVTDKPQFKVNILKESEATSGIPVQKKSEKLIETRRKALNSFNVYVPISEDLNPQFDTEVSLRKGMDTSGLSLIDLKGNILNVLL